MNCLQYRHKHEPANGNKLPNPLVLENSAFLAVQLTSFLSRAGHPVSLVEAEPLLWAKLSEMSVGPRDGNRQEHFTPDSLYSDNSFLTKKAPGYGSLGGLTGKW